MKLTLALLVAVTLAACDVLEQQPETSVDDNSVLKTADGAEATLLGAYDGLQSLLVDEIIFADLASDNAVHSGSYPSWKEVDTYTMLSGNAEARDHWINAYRVVNIANNIIQEVPGIADPTLSAKRRDAIVGEARAVRALAYHILVRWFGSADGTLGVPLVTAPTRAIDEGSYPSRASVAEVYDLIVSDLQAAEGLVSAKPAAGFIGVDAVQALLARVYLDLREYQNAADKAREVLDRGNFSLADVSSVYENLNSSESIFELQFSTEDDNALSFFAYPNGAGGRYEYSPEPTFAVAWEAGDLRKPYNVITHSKNDGLVISKYFRTSSDDDNIFVVRLPEVMLIRAEAIARGASGSLDEARDLLNQLRERAGLAPVTTTDAGALAEAILNERRFELAFEGHRRHDLVRTGQAVAVLGAPTEDMLRWPIPERDTNTNVNLVQNPGY